jgi:hypothetical protein
VDKVTSWIANPASNFGFIIQDYTNADGIDLASSEAASIGQRPILTITYK